VYLPLVGPGGIYPLFSHQKWLFSCGFFLFDVGLGDRSMNNLQISEVRIRVGSVVLKWWVYVEILGVRAALG
jgi:hypothetical protein